MKPEELVIGRSYQFTSKYIDEFFAPKQNGDLSIYFLINREQLASVICVYNGYDIKTKQYKFRLLNGLIKGVVYYGEETLKNLQEKPLE